VTSANLTKNHGLWVIFPSASVVTVGKFAHSSRSCTHCPLAAFQMKPRLLLPWGVGEGLKRTLT